MRACVYTRGLGTPIASQHNIFDSENLSQIFSCASSWHRRGSNLWSFDLESDRFYLLGHPGPSPHTGLLESVTEAGTVYNVKFSSDKQVSPPPGLYHTHPKKGRSHNSVRSITWDSNRKNTTVRGPSFLSDTDDDWWSEGWVFAEAVLSKRVGRNRFVFKLTVRQASHQIKDFVKTWAIDDFLLIKSLIMILF